MGYSDNLVKHLGEQGATVKRVKKGLMIFSPNGGAYTIHHTPSDRRSRANVIAGLRRIGLTHPDDKRALIEMADDTYPAYMQTPIASTTEKIIRQKLYEMGWPIEITSDELRGAISDLSTLGKALYQIGYRWHSDGKKKGKTRVWVAPDDIQELHLQFHEYVTEAIVETIDDDQPELPPVHEEAEVTTQAQPSREFIDSEDSWTVNRNSMPDEVLTYLRYLEGAGLETEIRVWRHRDRCA